MAADFLLEIDGIKGESSHEKGVGQIEIMSWSFGVSNAGSGNVGSGHGSGKASLQDIHFTSHTHKGSVTVFESCATGKHIPKAVLHCRKAGGKQEEYYVVTLTDVLVSSYQQAASDGGTAMPTDQFSLNFSKIELAYKAQKKDGSLDAVVKAGYDVKTSKKV